MINNNFIFVYLYRCKSLLRSVSQDVFIRHFFIRDFFNFQKCNIYRPLGSVKFCKPEVAIKIPYSTATISDSKNSLIELEQWNHLAKILNCSINEIQQLTKSGSKVCNFDTENLPEKLSILLERFSREAIKENLWLLEFSIDDLKSRLEEMDKWELNSMADKLLPLFKLSYSDFFRLSAKFIVEKNLVPGGNRIVFVANEMQCPIEKVVEKFMNLQPLLFRSFRQIKENIRLLKEFGVTAEELLQEFVALNITPEKMKARLEEIVKCDLSKHLWLIRSSEKTFRRRIELETENCVLQEGKSIEEYIHEKLDTSSTDMLHFKLANPGMFKKNPAKIRKMLEFFFSCGYSIEQISLSTYVLRHDLNGVKKRYAELTSYGVVLPKIRLLYLSQSMYDRIIERLKKTTLENLTKEQNEISSKKE